MTVGPPEPVSRYVVSFVQFYLSELAKTLHAPQKPDFYKEFLQKTNGLGGHVRSPDAKQQERTHRFMLGWFAGFFVVFCALASMFYLQRGMGNYTVVYTNRGSSIWSDSPNGRSYPVGIIATCLLGLGALAPLVFFSTEYSKHTKDYHQVDTEEEEEEANGVSYEQYLAPASHYVIFWVGTATMQSGMFLLAVTAAGVCELNTIISGVVTAFSALFVLYRVSYTDAIEHRVLAFLFAMPMPASVLVNLVADPGAVSSLDTAACAIFLAQYFLCFVVLLAISSNAEASIYLHRDFFKARRARNDERIRELFMLCVSGHSQADFEVVAASSSSFEHQNAVRTKLVGRIRKHLFKQGQQEENNELQKDLMMLENAELLRLWFVTDEHEGMAALRRTFWIFSGALAVCAIGAFVYGLLAPKNARDMRVTRAVCEKVVFDSTWPAAPVLFPAMFAVPALVLLFVNLIPSARKGALIEIKARLPLSWRFLATGSALAFASVIVMGAVGITDVHVMVVTGGLTVLAGFLQQRMRKPYDPAIQVAAVFSVLVPTACLIATAHAASVSPTRIVLCYAHAAVSLVVMCSAWMHECVHKAYAAIELSLTILVFVYAVFLCLIVLPLELFRF